MNLKLYEIVKTIINISLLAISFFLILRVLFLLFSFNQITPFVAWILSMSSFLMTPFAGIVSNLAVPTGVLDIVALITELAYLLVGYLLLSLLNILNERQIIKEYGTVAHYHEINKKGDEEYYHHHHP